MKLSSHSRAGLLAIAALAAIWAAGCSDDEENTDAIGGGGAAETGGGTTKGGGTAKVGGASGAGTTAPQGGASVGGAGVGGATQSAGTGNTPVTTGGTTAVGGTTQQVAGNAGAAPIVCGTTQSTIATIPTTFTSTVAASGFAEQGTSTNTGKVIVPTTTAAGGPADLCTGGCLQIGAAFVTGDTAWSKGVTVEKVLPGATNTVGVNLVGAKIVAKVAIDNPKNTPIQFKIFAQGPSPEWAWAEAGKVTSELGPWAIANGASDYVYTVVNDMPSTGTDTKTFCASNVVKFGIQVQTSAAVTADTAGTVNVYIQSITIYAPGTYVPPAAVGGAAGAAGAAGAPAAGNAGTAGTSS